MMKIMVFVCKVHLFKEKKRGLKQIVQWKKKKCVKQIVPVCNKIIGAGQTVYLLEKQKKKKKIFLAS